MRRETAMHSVTAVSLLLLVTGSAGFTCNVCLPPVSGSSKNQNTAMVARANITRTWPDVPEMHMGECDQFDLSAKYMKDCPTDDEFTTCTEVSTADWKGLSCGAITEEYAAGCYDIDGYRYCQCVTPMCNQNKAWAVVPCSALLILAIATTVALFL